MTKDEALKAAIKAIANSNSIIYEIMHAIADCKEALAQDEQSSSQEPSITKTGCGVLTLHLGFDDLPDGTKFYTTPPKEQQSCDKRPWVGLTDEEISQLWISTSPYFNEDDFAKAVETKLKEKNT